MGKDYYLSLGPGRRHRFSMPPKWVPVHFLEGEETDVGPSAGVMAAEALNKQVGAASSLRERLSRARNIAVIVDDATRPTPVADILDVLLSILIECGCSKDDITIVVALGTHVAMGREGLETRLGKGVVSAYRIVQHDAWQTDLVPVPLEDGRVVRINPVIAASDVKIGVSSILPHPMAGYGGGPKLLMPGVCDIQFIMGHHMRHGIHPRSRVGQALGNPFHEDCMMIARTIGLDLTIDCVYDRQGRIAGIVAGSLDEAFTEATAMCFEKLGHRFDEKVDVSITSSYPHTHGIQIYKGLAAPDIITRENGAILLMAPMVTPVPDEFVRSFVKVKEASRGDAIAFVTAAMSKGLPFLPDHSAEFNMAMSYAIRRSRMRTVLVAPMMSRNTALTLGFEHAASLEQGLDVLKDAYPEARVAIFPTGGLIVPIADWEQ
jgi:nickel-dependent lactate racemase